MKATMVVGVKNVGRFLGWAVIYSIIFLFLLGVMLFCALFCDDEPTEYWMGGQ